MNKYIYPILIAFLAISLFIFAAWPINNILTNPAQVSDNKDELLVGASTLFAQSASVQVNLELIGYASLSKTLWISPPGYTIRVGVGTSTPTGILDVAGLIGAAGANSDLISLITGNGGNGSGGSGGSSGVITLTSGNGGNGNGSSGNGAPGGNITITGGNGGKAGTGNTNGAAGADIILNTGIGGSKAGFGTVGRAGYIGLGTNYGNVGIGTTIPTTKLEVGQTASISNLIVNNASNFALIDVATVGYSRFGTGTTTHTNWISTASDLFLSNDLEGRGSISFAGQASLSSLFVGQNQQVKFSASIASLTIPFESTIYASAPTIYTNTITRPTATARVPNSVFDLDILTGNGLTGNQAGGVINILPGNGIGQGGGGGMEMILGNGGIQGNGGGGSITAGNGGTTSGNGGGLLFQSGDAGGGGQPPGNGSGGDITFTTGLRTGSGNIHGRYRFYSPTSSQSFFGQLDFKNLTTANQVYTFPDSTGILPLLELSQTFSALQIFSNSASVSPNFEVGGYASIGGNLFTRGTGSSSFAGSLNITKGLHATNLNGALASVSGSTYIAINSGNVGIGTSNPTAKLHVLTSDNSGVTFGNNGSTQLLGSSGGFANINTQANNIGLNLISRITTVTTAAFKLSNSSFGTDYSATSGIQLHTQLLGTLNETGTAGFTGLLLNFTETTVGTGEKRLFDAQIGGTSKFSIDDVGNIIASGSINLGGTIGRATTSYSRFGTSTTGHANYISTNSDLFLSNDLEVKGTVSFAGVASISGRTYFPGIAAGAAGDTDACLNSTTNELTDAGASTCIVSSRRYKKDIKELETGIEEILKLKPVEFVYKADVSGTKRIGLVAEDVLEVEPRLVFYEADGITPRGVGYEELTALLTKAIQEQQIRIDSLEDRIAKLEYAGQYVGVGFWQKIINFLTRIIHL